MNTLYERVAGTDDGAKRLAVARLRRQALRSLHMALKASASTQTELAKRLNVRKSAVSQVLNGDGNLRMTTLAEYLHALGFELDVRLVEAGEPRQAAVENREARPSFPVGAARSQEATADAPLAPAAAETESVHVVIVDSGHVLMQMVTHEVPSGTMRFSGSATYVPTPTAKPAFAPDTEFKPVESTR